MENTFRTSTSNVPEYKNSFNHLKEFSFFLSENLEQVSEYHLDLLVQHNFPLSKLFNTDDKKEILDFVRQDLKEFLENIQQSQIVEKELQRLKKQKTGTVPQLEKIGIKSSQIDLKLSLFRKTFLKFLPEYTQEVTEFQLVLTELEDICYYLNEQISIFQLNLSLQNLKQEKDFSQTLIDHSIDGIIAFDKMHRITEWNTAMEHSSGINKEFVIGKKIFDLFPGLDDTVEGTFIQRVLKGEKVHLPERLFANSSGFYEINGIPIFGVEGDVYGGFLLLHDVTHNKRAEQQLQESQRNLQRANEELVQQLSELHQAQEELRISEKLLKKTQQLAHMGNWVWEVKDNKIEWSDELRDIFEIKEKLKVGSIKNYLARVHPEDRKGFYRRMRNAVKSKVPFDDEHRILLEDGSEKFIYMQGIPEEVNEKLTITGFCQDVTQKRKAIETLQSSENRFRTLCEKSPDAIFLIERNAILYCNRSAVNMLGAKSKAEILRLTPDEISSDTQPDNSQSQEKISEIIRKAFEGESNRFEWVHKKLDGTPFWTEVIITPIKLEEKDVLHVVWRDISHRKRIELEVRKAEEQLIKVNNELEQRVQERTKALEKVNQHLVRVNADLDTFVYSASHDLRSPIANIEGLVNELVRHEMYQDEEVKWILDLVKVSIHKFKSTIDDLTKVTQIQKNEEEDIESLKLENLVEDIKFSIQNLITETSASIETDFSACSEVYFSRKNLRSVLFNLISNAIKYRSPERSPVVKLASEEDKEYVVLSVSDNGLGIKEEDFEKIFSMFKRLHTHVEGSGVGLYLVKRIIENRDGKIELESKEGVGSTFRLFFRKG